MSDRGRRDPRGTGRAAESKGEHRAADKADIRQQEIIESFRQRAQPGFFRRLLNALKAIFTGNTLTT